MYTRTHYEHVVQDGTINIIGRIKGAGKRGRLGSNPRATDSEEEMDSNPRATDSEEEMEECTEGTLEDEAART